MAAEDDIAKPLRIPDALPADAWVVTLDPPAVADAGRVELNINDTGGLISISQDGIDWGDAQIQEFLADQQVGSTLVDYRLPNRTVTINLSIGTGDEMSYLTAKQKLQQKVALFQREGGCLKRDTGVPLYADVVNATLTFPDHWGPTGFMENDVKLVLECVPDFYGDEVTLDLINGTGYIAAVLQQAGVTAVVDGDHPGRARIVAADTSGNDQCGLIWGVHSRYYDSATTAQLAYLCDLMTPLDAATVTGGTIEHPSLPGGSWCPVMLTDLASGGALTHTGTYRVLVRVISTTANPQLRLVWGVGGVSSPVTNTAVSIPVADEYCLLDLGVVTIAQPPVGAHTWQGIVQAFADDTGDTIQLHRVYFVPLDEFSGQVSAPQQDGSPLGIKAAGAATVGTDDAASGGTISWLNPGLFPSRPTQATDAGGALTHYLKATGFGLAVPSGATIHGIGVTVNRQAAGAPGRVIDHDVKLIKAGTVQATNRADTLTGWVPGAANKTYGSQSDLWGGAWTAADVNASNLGVALAANVYGEAVITTVTVAVYYTTAGGFVIDQNAVIYADQHVEVRSDGVFRASPDGSVYATIPSEGDLPRIPPSGTEGRPCELLVVDSRGDRDNLLDPAEDGLTVQVVYRPGFLFPA